MTKTDEQIDLHPLTPSLEDCRLAERVKSMLTGTGYGPLRNVRVTVRARSVILSGRVPTYHLKQVAQAIASSVPGAWQIHNELSVS